jgi:hypothetical protein
MAITTFLSNPTNTAEVIAFAAAVFTLFNRRAGYWKSFILYLFLTIVTEVTGYYFRVVLQQPNYPFYNLFMLIQSLFFAFLFYRFHTSRTIRIWIVVLLAAFIIFFVTEGVANSFAAYNKYCRQFLSVFVVLFSCTFYFTILKMDNVNNPLQYPPFWVVTGLFFFYFGSVAMFAFYERVSKIKLTGSLSFYTLVMGCLSCILYGSWVIGFICRRKQVHSSRP